MANDKFVQKVTSRDENFAQWYTDVVREAKLCDYSSVKGCLNYLPNGYAIWENIRNLLDKRFKDTGVENVYLPVLIPESLLKKEARHIEGFAPEVAWVTEGGNSKLEERMCIRPTSETLFCDLWEKMVKSYRDLPLIWNQFDIKYLDKENKLHSCYETSWGLSTRSIGALIMVHGDDSGLVLPPRIAPTQAMIIPIAQHKEGVLEEANKVLEALRKAGIRVKLDDSEKSPGFKFAEQEMLGIPTRIEMGPKDIEKGEVVVVRRNDRKKITVKIKDLAKKMPKILEDIQNDMFNTAKEFLESHIYEATTMDDKTPIVAVSEGLEEQSIREFHYQKVLH